MYLFVPVNNNMKHFDEQPMILKLILSKGINSNLQEKTLSMNKPSIQSIVKRINRKEK
jgi:hypothetical protein